MDPQHHLVAATKQYDGRHDASTLTDASTLSNTSTTHDDNKGLKDENKRNRRHRPLAAARKNKIGRSLQGPRPTIIIWMISATI